MKPCGDPADVLRLAGDPLHLIARLLPEEADRLCFRLACRAFCEHAPPPSAVRRAAFLRARALAAFACERLPGFALADATEMLALAAAGGCVEVLVELVDVRGCARALDHEVCNAAAAHGRVDALAWLRARGCPWGKSTCSAAAERGQLAALRYAHEHDCPWDSITCYLAAGRGQLAALRYAHERGCPWHPYTCSHAAEGGHLEVLRYAHEHGCPWDTHTCSRAEGKRDLAMLRYAHERGCPWDQRTRAEAADGGHLECVRYAREHGCPGEWELG
jgi:hypothetical protein